MYGSAAPPVRGTTAAAGSRWRGHTGRALAAVLPCACVGCHAALGWPAPPLLLCARCAGALRAPYAPACATCGRPLAGAAGGRDPDALLRCGACRAAPPPWQELAAAFLYRPPLTGVVRALKFRRAEHLGAALAGPLAAACERLRGEVELVVPVPLAWTRLLVRGYNQAEAIARPLAAALALPHARLLRRRPRRRQALLDRGERRRNLRGAFAARAGATPPRVVLLVDDVMTTGATLVAAALTLRGAGVQTVYTAVAARTPESSWDEASQSLTAKLTTPCAGD